MNETFQLALFGGVLGAAGQVIRMLNGLNKAASRTGDTINTSEDISNRRIFISLLIGFIAGLLAVVCIEDYRNKIPWTSTQYAGLIAAGYAGADFIESIMKRFSPDQVKANKAIDHMARELKTEKMKGKSEEEIARECAPEIARMLR